MTTAVLKNAVRDKYLYIIGIIILAIYLPALYDLVLDWYNDPNYSHGFLVPLISIYLVWRKREEIADIKTESSPVGLFLIFGAVILFILGNGASEYFTVRLSLVVLMFGVALYHLGYPMIKKTWFAFFFLLFMIPIPYVIYFAATFQMQLLASKITTSLLSGIGMTVVRQGNIIALPNQTLEVAEACSGLRSLISLLALGALFAYTYQKKFSAQIIMFLSTIPIAVLANVFRVFTTSVIVYAAEIDATAEPMHTLMGASVFIIAFILLLIEGAILRKVFK